MIALPPSNNHTKGSMKNKQYTMHELIYDIDIKRLVKKDMTYK
jgi:hypothetical protein